MARNNYKRKVNKTGYKKGVDTSKNNYNIIPDNSITMDGVDMNLLALIYDSEGELEGMKSMKPGENYKFEKGDHVLEVPQYKKGGKNEWISNKISKLVKEGKPHKQAIAIAYSMYENRGQSGMQYQSGMEYFMDGFDVNQLNNQNQEANQTEDPETTLDAPEKYQFFNPYAGVDIPMAANILGQSIESGNTLGTIASGVKLAAGLGRNITAGIGFQRANQQAVDSYNEKQRRDMTKAYYQAGGENKDLSEEDIISILEGQTRHYNKNEYENPFKIEEDKKEWVPSKELIDYIIKNEILQAPSRGTTKAPSYQSGGLTDQDVSNINASIGEVNFSPDTVRSLFEKVDKKPAPTAYTPNLGRYKDVGYFDVQGINGDSIILTNTERNPHNPQTIKNLLPYLKQINPGKNVSINYKFREGGEITKEELLSDEYSTGDDGMVNAEVEGGEYRKDPDGKVTEVVGKKHSQGGEEVSLEEGTKILSDYEKIGKKFSKELKEDFDLKVKASDTYATVLDKFKTKTGYNKIIKDLEEAIAKSEKELAKEDSATKDLNIEFLSKKIYELEEKKKPLEKAKQDFFDELFEEQEKAKGKDTEQENYQIGGQVYNSDQVVGFAERFGLDKDKVKEVLKKMQAGGEFGAMGEGKSLPAGQHKDTTTGLYGGITEQQMAETMLRNPWFDWQGFNPSNPADVMAFQKEFNRRSTEGKQIKEDGKFGIQTQSVMLPKENYFGVTKPNLEIAVPELAKKVAPIEVTPSVTEDEIQKGNLRGVLFPDQSPVMPSALQPVYKNERRYGRIDPALIDPTKELAEIDRSRVSLQSATNQRGDSSRAATLAQIAAGTQQASSNAISAANRYNAQARQTADAFNVRQGDREVDAAAADALSYEQRMLTGMSNTENDFRDYFETVQSLNKTNYDTINELNYLNALADNYQFTGTGFEQVGRTDSVEDMLRKVKLSQALGSRPSYKRGGKKYC